MLRISRWVIFAALLLAATPGHGASELEEVRAENKKLKDQVQDMALKLKACDAKCKAMESDLKAADKQQEKDTEKKLRELSDENAKLRRELEEMRKRPRAAENDQKAKELSDRLRAATDENDRLRRQIEEGEQKKKEAEVERKATAEKAAKETQEKLRTLTDESARLKTQLERVQRDDESARRTEAEKQTREFQASLQELAKKKDELQQKLAIAERLVREQNANASPKVDRGDDLGKVTVDNLRDELAATKEKLAREQGMRVSTVLPVWRDAEQELLLPKLAPDSLRVLLPASATGSLIGGKSGPDVVTLVEPQGDRATVVTFSLRAGRICCRWANEAAATRYGAILRESMLVLSAKDAQTVVSFR